MSGPTTSGFREPKRFDLPSSSFGITADDAADTLIRAEEVKANKPLMKEVKAILKSKKEAINKV